MELSNKGMVWITGLLLLSFNVKAQQVDTTKSKIYELTVKEAVDLAFKNVIELKNADLDYRIQQAKNKEIRGQALPQVSGNIGASRYIQLPNILFPQSDESVYEVFRQENLLPSTAQAPASNLTQFRFHEPWH